MTKKQTAVKGWTIFNIDGGKLILVLLVISYILLWNVCAENKTKAENCSGWHEDTILDPLGILMQGKSEVLVCNDDPHIFIYK